MVSVEELKERFVVRDVAPWGSCIVVPGKEFDPDWEAQLYDDEGFGCVFTVMGSEQVVLVRLGKVPKESKVERVVFTPEPKAPISPVSPTASTAAIVKHDVLSWVDPERLWSLEEETKLVNLWNHEPRFSALLIARQFPKRTPQAVVGRIAVLQNEGKIKSRYQKKSCAKVVKSPSDDKELKELSKENVAEKGKNTPLSSDWSEEDKTRLAALWNEGKSEEEIAAEFPNRTLKAVASCLDRLKKAGMIKPRMRGRRPGYRKKIQTKRDTGLISAPSRPPVESDETKSVGSGPGPMPTETPTPTLSSVSEVMGKPHEKIARGGPLPFTVTINVDVRVDCGNPASVEALKKLLKELEVSV